MSANKSGSIHKNNSENDNKHDMQIKADETIEWLAKFFNRTLFKDFFGNTRSTGVKEIQKAIRQNEDMDAIEHLKHINNVINKVVEKRADKKPSPGFWSHFKKRELDIQVLYQCLNDEKSIRNAEHRIEFSSPQKVQSFDEIFSARVLNHYNFEEMIENINRLMGDVIGINSQNYNKIANADNTSEDNRPTDVTDTSDITNEGDDIIPRGPGR